MDVGLWYCVLCVCGEELGGRRVVGLYPESKQGKYVLCINP